MLSKEYKYLVHTSRKLTVCSIGAPHLKPLSVAFTWPPEASRCNLCLFYIMNTNCLIKKALGSVVGDLTNSSKSQMSRSQREIRKHFFIFERVVKDSIWAFLIRFEFFILFLIWPWVCINNNLKQKCHLISLCDLDI